jgi:hypothetical protein
MDMLPEKRRSNAVLGVEHIMTASPEFFEGKSRSDILNWSQQSHNFLVHKYGEDRIAYSTLHLDEKSPHIHAVIVPLEMEETIDPEKGLILDPSVVKDKLNARQIFGGRRKMIQLQDEYHKSVEFFGLDRGIKGSTATHIDIKKFYAMIEDPNLVKTIRENRPKKEHALDLTVDKRTIEWYKEQVSPVATVNIKTFDFVEKNGTKPLKKEIDSLGLDITKLEFKNDLLKKENDKIIRDMKRLEKSLKDAETLGRAQRRQINNVAEYLSRNWKTDKKEVLSDFDKMNKKIESEKQIQPTKSKGMNMNM